LIDFYYNICIIKRRENKAFDVLRLPDGRVASVQRRRGGLSEPAESYHAGDGVCHRKKTRSKGVLFYAAVVEDYKDESSFQEVVSVLKKVLRIPDVPLGRMNQMKMAIIQALSKNPVKKGDK
jgi:hypothetical protein